MAPLFRGAGAGFKGPEIHKEKAGILEIPYSGLTFGAMVLARSRNIFIVDKKAYMVASGKKNVGRPRKGTRGLDLKQVIDEAWKIVDEQGIAKLSTRSLAASLHVQSPALYWHVKSKEELLSLMIEDLLQHSLSDSPAGMSWQDWLKHIGRRQRNLLLSHRDSGMVAALAPPTERLRTELFPKIFGPLVTAGFSAQEASSTAGALAGMVLGWVIYEQRRETLEFVESFHSPGEGFELALDLLVQGAQVRIAPQK